MSLTTPTIEAVVFEHEERTVGALYEAGVRSFMVDHEYRDKHRRQADADTEVNGVPLAEVARIAKLSQVRVHCRLNSWYEGSLDEIETAVDGGAARIYLPMVKSRGEMERFVRAVDGRTETAIVAETQSAIDDIHALGEVPIDAVYIGLNDLAISRGKQFIFGALADGTVPRVRAAFPEAHFGYAGVTCIDCGSPIPTRLIMADLVANGADFSFLRRSFRRDIVGRDTAAELDDIVRTWAQLRRRGAGEIARDREALLCHIRRWNEPPA
ncbi:MAG TPA: hypothetical protein VM900_04980 [Sphingomonas sp.]|nr:hypothetical protein [Sphingomonas sp.]